MSTKEREKKETPGQGGWEVATSVGATRKVLETGPDSEKTGVLRKPPRDEEDSAPRTHEEPELSLEDTTTDESDDSVSDPYNSGKGHISWRG